MPASMSDRVRSLPFLLPLLLVTLGACDEVREPVAVNEGSAALTKSATAGREVILYGVNSGDDGLSIIDPETGQVTYIGRLSPYSNMYTTPIALTIGLDNEILVWNNSNDASTGVLLRVDASTGLASPVNPAAGPQGLLGALAMSATGRLLGFGNGSVFEIDPATGIRQYLFGVPFNVAGADFHPRTGVIYAAELGGGALWTIDPEKGAAVKVADLSENIGVLGSIVFDWRGDLLGSSFGGPLGMILFEIDPTTGAVSNIRQFSGGGASQGLGFVPTRRHVRGGGTGGADRIIGQGRRSDGVFFDFDVVITPSGRVNGKFTAVLSQRTLLGSVTCGNTNETRGVFGGVDELSGDHYTIAVSDDPDGIIIGTGRPNCDTCGFGDPAGFPVVEGYITIIDR